MHLKALILIQNKWNELNKMPENHSLINIAIVYKLIINVCK